MYVRPSARHPRPTDTRTQDPHDPISLLSAWLALLPQALMIVYATALFCTREVECALMLAGQLACEAANFVLKWFIREERPKGMSPSVHFRHKGRVG